MSKVAIQGNASGTGTFTIAAPNSNTDRTLTLPDEAGTVLTSASDYLSSTDNISTQATQNVPAFQVQRDSAQSFSLGTETISQFNTVALDTDSWYDSTNYRYVPQIAGWYWIYYQWGIGSGTIQAMYATIKKNGSNQASRVYFDTSAATDDFVVSASKLIYFNGSTDYVDFHMYQAGGTGSMSGNSSTSYAEGFLVRAA